MIRDPLVTCHFIINGKHAIYFLFLKHFIDIAFVETVRCKSFLVYTSSTTLSSIILLMCPHYLSK